MKYLFITFIPLTLTISAACTCVTQATTRAEAPVAPAPSISEPAPTPLTLVWDNSPSPHGSYLLCSDRAPKDFCLAETKWWGDCSSPGKGRVLKSGDIKVDEEGKVVFSGCDDYDFLIADSVVAKYNLANEKAIWPRRISGCIDPDVSVFDLGNMINFLAVRSDYLYWVREPAPFKMPDDMCDLVKASQVAHAKTKFPIRLALEGVKRDKEFGEWSVEPVGDLNGDGNLEVILYARIEGGQNGPQAAMLATVGDTLTPLAVTVQVADLGLHSPERKAVMEVQVAYDECEYWAGEPVYNEQRAKETAEKANKACAEYNKLLIDARKRYPKNKELAAFENVP